MFVGTCKQGIMMEARQLKTTDGNVWRQQVNLSFLGGSISAIVDDALYAKAISLEGKNVSFSGTFATGYKGNMDFTLTSITETKDAS
jgi:hypothetical protein